MKQYYKNLKLFSLGEMTTKKDVDNHGFVIINLKDAICKYNGEIEFQCNESQFSVSIVLFDVL